MTQYSYEIGPTSSTTNVESLATPVNPPRGEMVEWSITLDRADGTVAAHGYPAATWTFDFITQAMVDQLRTFCSGKSAAVYIKTRKPDGTFAKYSCIMLWPDDQLQKRGPYGKYSNVVFHFRKLEAA